MKELVSVVVVLYNAELSESHKTLLADEFVTLIVVDNTPDRDLSLKMDRLVYIPLRENLGIATAQNEGVRKACALGCDYVIFFDQDSEIPKHYVRIMMKEYKRIKAVIPNLFMLGPTITNGRTKEIYKSTIHRDVIVADGFIQRREVISSGVCVDVKKLEFVGLNDDSLFIDYVDFEVCWRANSKGYVNGITTNVELTHYVGQQEYRLLNQLVIISSPIRYYYQIRNYIWLARRSYVPMQWKVNRAIKLILFPLSYPFKVKSWRKIYAQMFRGLKDGILKKY